MESNMVSAQYATVQAFLLLPAGRRRRKDALAVAGLQLQVGGGGGGGRQHPAAALKQKEGKRSEQEFLQLHVDVTTTPALVSPFRCWCFWLPASDCDCPGGLPMPSSYAMDSWSEHSWRLQQKATVQLEFFTLFFSMAPFRDIFLLDDSR